MEEEVGAKKGGKKAKTPRGKAKVKGSGGAKSSSAPGGARGGSHVGGGGAQEPPVVKVPSSEARLNELKHALEDGMRDLEDGAAATAAAVEELRHLEARMTEVKDKIAAQESNANRTTRRLKQTARKLQEQAVNTDMLTATMVTKTVKRATKSRDPAMAEVAATCASILSEWKAMVMTSEMPLQTSADKRVPPADKEEKKEVKKEVKKEEKTEFEAPDTAAAEPAAPAPEPTSVADPAAHKLGGVAPQAPSVLSDILGAKATTSTAALAVGARGVGGSQAGPQQPSHLFSFFFPQLDPSSGASGLHASMIRRVRTRAHP